MEHTAEYVASVWKANDERNQGLRYPDGSLKTFFPGKPWLNEFGYSHRVERCTECGSWECDLEGIGHYRG